jgi:hypothetical protein
MAPPSGGCLFQAMRPGCTGESRGFCGRAAWRVRIGAVRGTVLIAAPGRSRLKSTCLGTGFARCFRRFVSIVRWQGLVNCQLGESFSDDSKPDGRERTAG